MKKGMLKTNSISMVDVSQEKKDFVTVSIKSKDGYGWEVTGDAGMVVIHKEYHSEVDIVGSKEDCIHLLATALLKVRELLHEDVVKAAIKEYEDYYGK